MEDLIIVQIGLKQQLSPENVHSSVFAYVNMPELIIYEHIQVLQDKLVNKCAFLPNQISRYSVEKSWHSACGNLTAFIQIELVSVLTISPKNAGPKKSLLSTNRSHAKKLEELGNGKMATRDWPEKQATVCCRSTPIHALGARALFQLPEMSEYF